MKKFTKQITALLTAAAAAGVAANVSAVTQESTPEAGVALNTETSSAVVTEVIDPESTPEAGVALNTEATTTVSTPTPTIGTFVTSTTTAETTTEEEFYPTAGVPVAPGYEDENCDETCVTTLEEEYPTAGDIMAFEGDVNMDGVADMTDLTDLSLYLLHDKDLDLQEQSMADLTHDGNVDIADLAKLKQIVSHNR